MNTQHPINRLGGPSLVARELGIRSQAVSQWLHSTIPLDRVDDLMALAKKRHVPLTPEDLYPDFDWAVVCHGCPR